jgi:hypothetical protein
MQGHLLSLFSQQQQRQSAVCSGCSPLNAKEITPTSDKRDKCGSKRESEEIEWNK